MALFELQRTGFPDLTFQGQLLAHQSGETSQEKTGERRHVISVYQTDDDQFIVAVSFQTSHPGEVADSIAEVVEDLGQVEETLSLYDPEIHLDDASLERNSDGVKSASRELTRQYDLQVDSILRELETVIAANKTRTTG